MRFLDRRDKAELQSYGSLWEAIPNDMRAQLVLDMAEQRRRIENKSAPFEIMFTTPHLHGASYFFAGF